MAKILGVASSLRADSNTRKLLKLLLEEARVAGGEVKLLDLSETCLPMYDPEHEEPDPNQRQARELVLWADAFVLGSPDYHGSMSGAMKNFLDHFWEEFAGKLFGVIVSSHEKGLTVQDQIRTAVRQCYGWSLPYGIGFNGEKAFDGEGRLVSGPLGRRVRMMARDLVVYGALIHGQFQADLVKDPPPPSFAGRYRE